MQFRPRISHRWPRGFLFTDLPEVLDPSDWVPADNLQDRDAVVIPEWVQSEKYAAQQKPAEDPAVGGLDSVSNLSWKLKPGDIPLYHVSNHPFDCRKQAVVSHSVAIVPIKPSSDSGG